MLRGRAFLLFFVLFVTETQAWPARIAEQSPQFEHPADAFIDTLLGACKTPNYQNQWFSSPVPGKSSFQFKVSPSGHGLFKGNRFKTTAFYVEDNGQLKPAPLMVLLPGIFTSSDDNASLALATAFHKQGYHVVIVPNGWSREFIDKSLRPMGDLDYESDVVLRVIRQFQARLRQAGALGRTQMLGVSYGGFVGSMVAYRDTHEGHNLIDGQVILLGAPLNMRWAMQNLDSQMDDSEEFAQQRNGFADLLSKNFFCNQYEKLELNNSQPDGHEKFKSHGQVARHLVIQQGFRKYLKDAVTQIDGNEYPNHKLPLLIPDMAESQDYSSWSQQVRFNRYFEDYDLQDLLNKYSNEKAFLSYWVNGANQYAENKVLVMEATNDFLNEKIPLKTMQEALLMLPRGGHVGYAAWEWTQNLIFYMLQKDLKQQYAAH